jgi:hypothetical protein
VRSTQLLTAAVEVAEMGARGEAYGAVLVERARSLLGVDGGVAVTRWRFESAGPSVSVDIETDMTEMMPTAEMLRRAEQVAPHYPGITSMLTAGCAQPFRVSDVVNLRSFGAPRSSSACTVTRDDSQLLQPCHLIDRAALTFVSEATLNHPVWASTGCLAVRWSRRGQGSWGWVLSTIWLSTIWVSCSSPSAAAMRCASCWAVAR